MMSFEIQFKTVASLYSTSNFRYNLWEGAWKLYTEDMKLLATVLVLFSGFWPYVKLCSLAYLTLSPEKIFKNQTNVGRRVLQAFLIFGKWSWLDLCIVICVMEAISFSGALGWAQATALEGAFFFSSSVFMMQVLSKLVPNPFVHHPAKTDGFEGVGYGLWFHQNISNQLLLLVVVLLASLVSTGYIMFQKIVLVRCYFNIAGVDVPLSTRSFSLVDTFTDIFDNDRLSQSNRYMAIPAAILIFFVPIVESIYSLYLWAECWKYNRLTTLDTIPNIDASYYRFLYKNRRNLEASSLRLRWIGQWGLLDVYSLAIGMLILELRNLAGGISKNLEITITAVSGYHYLLACIALIWTSSWALQRVVASLLNHNLSDHADEEKIGLVADFRARESLENAAHAPQ